MTRIIICGVIVLAVFSYLTPLGAKTNEEIYQEKLAQLKPDDVKEHYELGFWCLQNKLLEQAKTQFNKVLETDPEHKKTLQGLDKVGQLIQEARMQEIIKKYGSYKGVLDKAGADKESLSWEQAREKETEHFVVRTNLSVDALNDMCILMESAYLKWHDFFGFGEPNVKPRVLVAKNRNEFGSLHRNLTGSDAFALMHGRNITRENPDNKTQKDHILTYYHFEEHGHKTSNLLLHEGTHYAIGLVVRSCPVNITNPPQWLEEGLTTYFESGQFNEGRLVINQVNRRFLPDIKAAVNNRSYARLKDFIELPKSDYDFLCYAQGWSLIYFLFNSPGGKYQPGLEAYLAVWKKNKIRMKATSNEGNIQGQERHIKIFEKCMGVPIDQLEAEWKEYILKLK